LLLSLTTAARADEPPEPPAPAPAPLPPPEAPLVAPPAAPAGFHYELFGVLRLKGGFIQDDPNVAYVGRNDGFTLQNARLGVQGRWDRLFFRFSADGAVDERDGANAVEGTLRFALKDAFVDVRLVDALSLRLVRFEPIFDLEEVIPITERLFADYALESRGVLPTQGYETPGLSPGRSLGVAVRSDAALQAGSLAFGYELAIANGNGEYASANDNDSFAVSLAIFARSGKSFAFVAGRHKSRSVGTLPFRQTQEDTEGAGGARLVLGPVEVAGQVIARHTEYPTTGGPSQNSVGAHGQLGVAIPVGADYELVPAYRFAIYDPSDLVSTDLVTEHSLALTLRFLRLPLRLQIDATHVTEQAGRELDNDRLFGVVEVAL
jgi:hypothetical protein